MPWTSTTSPDTWNVSWPIMLTFATCGFLIIISFPGVLMTTSEAAISSCFMPIRFIACFINFGSMPWNIFSTKNPGLMQHKLQNNNKRNGYNHVFGLDRDLCLYVLKVPD